MTRLPIKNFTAFKTHCSDAFRRTEKFILEDHSSSVLPQFKKYHPSGNLEFIYLGILQSFKLRILIGKSFQILLS